MKYDVKKEFERREKEKAEQNRQDKKHSNAAQNIMDWAGLFIMLLLVLFFLEKII